MKIFTDGNGITWAKRGQFQVSIPRGIAETDREAYAAQKLDEQAVQFQNLRTSLNS